METDQVGKPAGIISAPNAERPDKDTAEISRLAVLHCLGENIGTVSGDHWRTNVYWY